MKLSSGQQYSDDNSWCFSIGQFNINSEPSKTVRRQFISLQKYF